MSYKSAQGYVYKAIRAILKGDIPIGEGASYPRIEIHSFNEGEPLDKGGAVRELECIVESMSVRGYGDAAHMNSDNLDKLIGATSEGEGIKIIAIRPGQLTELTETLDTQAILYRQLQRIKITAEWQQQVI